MKKFENLGRSLTKREQKQIGGGQTCYTRCSSGNLWGLECNGSCNTNPDAPGYIFCNGQPYNYGCQGPQQ